MYASWTNDILFKFSFENSSGNVHKNEIDVFNSLPLRFDSQSNFVNRVDLSNPFNIVFDQSSDPSVFSSGQFDFRRVSIDQQKSSKINSNYFEPLPFFQSEKQTNHPQLSQKHIIIKQMIAKKNQQIHSHRMKFNNDHRIQVSSHRDQRLFCSFCKSNGESVNVYTSHVLRNVSHEIECPVLMAYICPRCGATGKSAHTIKYCTALSEKERVALPKVKLFREGRSSSGNMNLFKRKSQS